MSTKATVKQKIDKYLFEHKKTKNTISYIWALIMLMVSAFIYAFGFRAFIAPEVSDGGSVLILVTGGMSGVSQIFVKITQFILQRELTSSEMNTLQSIYYLVLNIPIVILAYKGIGKRFAFYTVINVVLSSLFLKAIPSELVMIFENLASDNITRTIFAGMCTGLSSSLALMVDGSAGGLDVVSYYIALKKSTSVGKYVLIINAFTISLFTLLSYLPVVPGGVYNNDAWIILLYAIIYLFVVSMVVDNLSKRNKKAQIQIITTKDDMKDVLLANFKHGCTIIDAKGAFSGENKKILYMVVSSYEVKSVIKVAQEHDHQAFINVVSVQALYGRFYIDPIK